MKKLPPIPNDLPIAPEDWAQTPAKVRRMVLLLYNERFAKKEAADQEHDTLIISGAARPAETPEAGLTPNDIVQNRYRVTGILHTGKNSAVYMAYDLHFPHVRRRVAIKEMLASGKRGVALQRFERQAGVLAVLDHPAIPQIYDYFIVKDQAYLVMQYINGRTLTEITTRANEFINTAVVLEWAIALCDVLGYLHGCEPGPVIFRNMQPNNIMIDQHRQIRLVGFGLAKHVVEGQNSSGEGAEGYTPPEQGQGRPTPESDVYALGATLYHILTRQEPPFAFHAQPIQAVNPRIPAAFAATVMQALAPDPEDRPSALRMKAALEALRF